MAIALRPPPPPPPPPPRKMHVSASGGRCGRPVSGSIAVLALSALLAAPAAGQTPLADVPASAAGPVHFSQAVVTRQALSTLTLIHFLSSTSPDASDVLPVIGRDFRLGAVAVTVTGYQNPNTWFVRGVPSISPTDLAELAVVVVGPAGTTPRVMRLSLWVTTLAGAYPTSVNYVGPTVTWASQLHTDLNTYPTPSDWKVLVVDHTNPYVDLDALTYSPPEASISSTNPATLTESNLDGATIVVTLHNAAFETGVTAAGFELVTTITGVTINSVSRVSSGDTSATLTLASTADLSAAADLAVRVLASAHSGDTDLNTGTVRVVPVRGVGEGPPADRAPVVVNAPDAVVLDPGGSTTIELARVFRDPNWRPAGLRGVVLGPGGGRGVVVRFDAAHSGRARRADDRAGLGDGPGRPVGVFRLGRQRRHGAVAGRRRRGAGGRHGAAAGGPGQAERRRHGVPLAGSGGYGPGDCRRRRRRARRRRWRGLGCGRRTLGGDRGADSGRHDDRAGPGMVRGGDRGGGRRPADAGRATQAQVAVLEGVCDRTAAVAAALSRSRDCTAPTPAELAATGSLVLDGARHRRPAGGGSVGPDWAARAGPAPQRSAGPAGRSAVEHVGAAGAAAGRQPAGRAGGRRAGQRAGTARAGSVPTTPWRRWRPASSRAWPRCAGCGWTATCPGGPAGRPVRRRGESGFAASGRQSGRAVRAAPGAGTHRRRTVGAGARRRCGRRCRPGRRSTSRWTCRSPPCGCWREQAQSATSTVAAPAAGGAVRLEAAAPSVPETMCDGQRCWRGLEAMAGEPLLLFARPPLALPAPTPEALFGDLLRLPLASLAEPGEPGGELEWSASSSDPCRGAGADCGRTAAGGACARCRRHSGRGGHRDGRQRPRGDGALRRGGGVPLARAHRRRLARRFAVDRQG